MRRVIESTLLSLDGVNGSPHLWASERFDDEARPVRSRPKSHGSRSKTERTWSSTATGRSGAELLERGLLDELQFAIHPVFVGEGATLHRDGATATLALTDVKSLGTGVVVLTYRPAGAVSDG